jgi:L-ascorbate metabolism protein UlaG (beta-lactamase superfamily)
MKSPRARGCWIVAVALIAASVAAMLAWLRHISAPPYHGPISDHFDGERFHNLEPTADKSLADLLRWGLNSEKNKVWQWRSVSPGVPAQRVEDLRVTLVNHATVLIQVAGINILTDPIWSERTSPFRWAGPRRYHGPGIRFEDLPPIDVVLVSHNHWDHLDLPTLQRLAREHRPRFVVPLGNRAFLERHGVAGAEDVDWWDRVSLRDDVEIVSVPVQHWSSRTRQDLRKTLWCGYVVRSPRGNVYFGGDTGLASGKVFRLATERLGPFRLALIPIGAYLPRWFMKDHHLSPADAIETHRILGAETSIAIHHGCFDLGDDSRDQASATLLAELTQLGPSAPDIRILPPGGSF